MSRAIELFASINLSVINEDVVLSFSSSNISSRGQFFTDLNSFQIQKRIYRKERPLQANYYPITSHLFIEDDMNRLTIHTRQAHGGCSKESGELEVALDRRLKNDDNRGLKSGVLDNLETPLSFLLTVEKQGPPYLKSKLHTPSLLSHRLSLMFNHPLQILLGMKPLNGSQINVLPSFSPGLQFPEDIHFIALKSKRHLEPSEQPFSSVLQLTRLDIDRSFEFAVSTDIVSKKKTGFHTPTTSHVSSRNSIELMKLFNDSQFHMIQCSEHTLTLLHEFNESDCQQILLFPFDIKTFVVSLEPVILSNTLFSPVRLRWSSQLISTDISDSQLRNLDTSQYIAKKISISQLNSGLNRELLDDVVLLGRGAFFITILFVLLALAGVRFFFNRRRFLTILIIIAFLSAAMNMTFFYIFLF